MVMSDNPKLTNFEKRYRGLIFFGSNDSDGGFCLVLKAPLLTQKKICAKAERSKLWKVICAKAGTAGIFLAAIKVSLRDWDHNGQQAH